MRIVRWSPQQRVDVPDKTAENFIALGEFRRLVRALIIGNSVSTAKIIRGFKVEAESPVSAQVVVKLDPGGGNPYSVAVGAESMGSYLDWGQLIGDKDHYNSLEGNATYAIDFSVEAPNTYGIWLSFQYTTGENDNRAFWNPATDAEYIDTTATRHVPAIEIVINTASPGAEYAHLADVVWDGVSIAAGDITDKRDLAFEGPAPNTQTSIAGSGGMPDFDRSTPRADFTDDAIYTVLKKIGRQIQDIKGPNDLGLWSFHSRVVKPMDPDGVLGTTAKSIATMDTLEYVVGDGTTTWGDFNGTAGLQDCLDHIDGSEADLPTRIRIRLKSRQIGTADYLSGTTPIWTCSSGITIATTKHIEIIGDVSKADKYGRVPVAFTHTATSYFTFTGTGGSLTLRNIAVANLPDREIFRSFDSVLNLDNTLLCADSSVYAVRTHSALLLWERSEVYGKVQLYKGTSQDTDGASMRACRLGSRVCYGTQVNGHLRLWGEATFGDDPTLATTVVNNMGFSACEFFYNTSTDVPLASRPACIDARGALNISFADCDLFHGADWDGILLGVVGPTNGYYVSKALQLEGITFSASAPTNASHAVSGGYGGALGTGWSIRMEADPTLLAGATPVDSALDNLTISAVRVSNCFWTRLPSLDSGAILVDGLFNAISIDNCRVQNASFPSITYTGTPSVTGIYLREDAALLNGKDSGTATVSNCDFGRVKWGTTEPTVKWTRLRKAWRGSSVRGCNYTNSNLLGEQQTFTAADGCIAIQIMQGDRTNVSDCSFVDFLDSNPGSTTAIYLSSTGYARSTIESNYFRNTTYCVKTIAGVGSNDIQLIGNRWHGAPASWLLYGASLPATSQVLALGNQSVGATGSFTAIDYGDSDNVVIANNDFESYGLYTGASAVVPKGFGSNIGDSKSRVITLPGALLAGSGDTGFTSAMKLVGRAAYGGGASAYYGAFDLGRYIPENAIITRVRVAYERGDSAGTTEFNIKRATYDKTATVVAETNATIWTVTDAAAGDYLRDSNSHGTFTSGNAPWSAVTQSLYAEFFCASNPGNDTVWWIEITFTDFGPSST